MSLKERKNLKGDDQLQLNPNENHSKMKSIHQLHSLFFIIGLLYFIFIANISKRIIYSTPDLKDSNLPFIGLEAWKDLNALNDIGPKVSGTPENEVIATNYIKKRIEQILSKSHDVKHPQFDHQIVSGSYFLDFAPGMIAAYRSVQNLVVRLEGESPNALLLNCHYDSVIGSPGANDDIANCAIMLEILSILSNRSIRNRHTIIFLFNGAEEVSLRGSHGFITQHKWAKDIKVVINLEAAGSGAKEILFQSGPGNSWLLNHYHAVKRPFAQVSSEEIFQSGIIPSDTDFRIFRDFGNLVGLDFAHFLKGYRYHTKYDHVKFLTLGCIQRTGENILDLSLSIANGNELDNMDNFKKDDYAVYFDYLGFVFVHYTKEVGVILNFLITLAAIITPFLTLAKATVNVHKSHILSETFLGLISIIIGTGVSLLVSYVTGYILDKIGHSMTWYRNTFIAPGIYSSITILMLMLSYDVIDATLANKYSPLSLALKVQARLNGINILWGILTLGLTVTGLRSGYLFMMILLISFISNILIYMFGLNNSVNKWLYILIICQFFSTLWTTYFYNAVMEMFIPVMGRAGSNNNPEALISVMSCVTTLFIVSYFIPLTQLLRGKTLKYLSVIMIFLITIYLATSTHIGFPYQDDLNGNNPTPQRHHILHTARTFYDINGNVRHSDGGLLFIEWDRNSLKTIQGVTMPIEPQTLAEMCNNEPLCGLPIVQSRMIMLGLSWVPASKPKVLNNAKIDSHSKFKVGNDLVKYVFQSNSTSLTALYIRVRDNAELKEWSFSNEFRDLSNQTYFVSFANGLESEIKPMKFDVTLKVKTKINEPLIDVITVTVRSDREEDFDEEFKQLIKRFPNWTFPVAVIAGVNSYTF
ncbi:hypothetical protein PVAND_013989 [Polypedilum vanderplanki]|uniref:FXNA-like protease n=1 Tax=Polypedilum vanderplanki TaxID=319348 RepID=A0A9J6CS62_POLVA|nr:hypothetical protein PVAND_013989 [Polypedilum vanderplanki]